MNRTESKLNVKSLAFAALMTALMAVCSWISLSVGPVSFTLQIFAVFFALEFLGGKYGTASIIAYMLLGAIGLPVFAGFSGGLSALFGSTGGYIIGFLFIGITYYCFETFIGSHIAIRIAALLIGLFLCYTFGTLWFVAIYTRNNGAVSLFQALQWCVFPFVPFDLTKLVAAFLLSGRIKKYVKL